MKESSVVGQYRQWLAKFGDTPQGMGWNKEEQAPIRYQVMLEALRESPASLLDFGCGTARFLDYIQQRGISGLEYCGLDILPESIALAKKKHPSVPFLCGDILHEAVEVPACDYIIINGILTYKHTVAFEEMWTFGQAILKKLFARARKGLAVNFMSTVVDWKREDLFHMPVPLLLDFVTKDLTRNFVLRHDYRLFEYTLYLYK